MKINDALNLLNIKTTATQEEIKKAYKAASLKNHPDKNPNGLQMMQAINAAYQALKKMGDTVTPTAGFNACDFGEELNTVLSRLFSLKGLIIEVCGSWIWISGDTKPHKAELGKNGIGCSYSGPKKMWYYRSAESSKSKRGRGLDMDSIRGLHGSTTPKRTTQKTLK